MSDTPIFEIRDSSGVVRWSISRDGENYRTIGAGHFMCKEMAKEIERLRTALEEAERDAGRWGECERMAEARGFTTNEWVLLFGTTHGTLQEQVDAAIEQREQETKTDA